MVKLGRCYCASSRRGIALSPATNALLDSCTGVHTCQPGSLAHRLENRHEETRSLVTSTHETCGPQLAATQATLPPSPGHPLTQGPIVTRRMTEQLLMRHQLLCAGLKQAQSTAKFPPSEQGPEAPCSPSNNQLQNKKPVLKFSISKQTQQTFSLKGSLLLKVLKILSQQLAFNLFFWSRVNCTM